MYEYTKKKLLMGITLSETGGSQKVVYSILSRLPEAEFDVTLVTAPDGELIKWVNELNNTGKNIKIIELESLKRNISIKDDIRAFFKLLEIMLKGHFQIAHFHNSKIGILGRIAAWIARVPKILYTVHGYGLNNSSSYLQHRLFVYMEKLATRVSTKVICVCNSDMEKGVSEKWIKRSKACVIHNGLEETSDEAVDIHKHISVSEDTPVLATVMRLSIPKEPVFTIKVAAKLRELGYSFKLLIVGDGQLRSICESLIDELDLREYVILLGFQDNVRALIQNIDIFMLFSKWEGLPVSIIEAMFAGKPVVASNTGGINELVFNELNGFLVNNFNINEGALAIGRLMDDQNLRKKQGEVSSIIAKEKYSIDKMMEKYISIYRE